MKCEVCGKPMMHVPRKGYVCTSSCEWEKRRRSWWANPRNQEAARWQQYKTDFLRANHCTEQEFHDNYVAFMEGNPTPQNYREFADKYQIRIHPDPNIPSDMQAVLSVNIAAIKVMARSYAESLAAVKSIISQRSGF